MASPQPPERPDDTALPPTTTAPSQTTPAPKQHQQQPPNLYLHNDPARTGFDPATNYWVTLFRALTGGLTREGLFHFREARACANEARDVARAERDRDWLLRWSPTVTFLNERIAELDHGRRLDAAAIRCRRCPARLVAAPRAAGAGVGAGVAEARMAGGFEPAHGILVCANEVRDRGHLEDVLAHEMVHAYDHLRWEVDFKGERNPRQAACTEIRASMLSGECRFTREFFARNKWRVTEQFQECVRRHAVMSLMARPWIKDEVHAVKTVNEVWDSCFADTRPFDEVYR